jgi:hypothetical protein
MKRLILATAIAIICVGIAIPAFAYNHNSNRAVQAYLSFLNNRGWAVEGGQGGMTTVTHLSGYDTGGDIGYLTGAFLNEYGKKGCGIYDFVKNDMVLATQSSGFDKDNIIYTIKRYCGE